MKAKTILEKFPKTVIIAFVVERFWVSLGKSANKLESELLYIQWLQESDAAIKECDEALAERKKHALFTAEHAAAEARWQRGNDRYKRADRLYARMEKLRKER